MFDVVDNSGSIIFATCTTYEKANKAKALLIEAGHFEDELDIIQCEIPVDVVVINEKLIQL